MSTQEGEGGTVQQAKGKGQEMVSQAQQQVQEKAQAVKGEAGGRLREQVDQRSTQAGEQAQSFAGTIRKTAEQLRGEGSEGQARFAEQAAERVERVGGYLRDSDSDRIFSDVEGFARGRPWLVGGAAALLGFLASRFLKASGERRYEQRSQSGEYYRRPYEPVYGDAYTRPASPELGTGPYVSTGAGLGEREREAF